VPMTLSELAASLGLTVPQILARAVQVDPRLLSADPGSQVLSQDTEMKLRTLLEESLKDDVTTSQPKGSRSSQRRSDRSRTNAGVKDKHNRSIAALADEYGFDHDELIGLALSLGYQAAARGGKLSIAQVNQLLLHLNKSAELSFGEANSTTIAGAIKNAGKLREKPQSRKLRNSPNLRRTRLEVLALQWNTSVSTLSELCGVVRIAIHDPESPRIANDDLLKLRTALHVSLLVAERWEAQPDVRLSKIAGHCKTSLLDLRNLCETLGITMLKRERIHRDDVVYLLVEIERSQSQRTRQSPAATSGITHGLTLDSAPTDPKIELRLDGLSLTEQDFSFATLTGASFRGCELTRANFTGADLIGADFSGAILRYAVFERAVLRDAVFERADVRFAKFGGAVINVDQLVSALVEGAEIADGDGT